jgi:hypothetical protein
VSQTDQSFLMTKRDRLDPYETAQAPDWGAEVARHSDSLRSGGNLAPHAERRETELIVQRIQHLSAQPSSAGSFLAPFR